MKFLLLEQRTSAAERLLDSLLGLGEARLFYFGPSLSKTVRETFYEVTFVDINLCKRNGHDPIDEIRNESPRTKIILTTFLTNLQEVSSVFWHPCDGYLQKPVKTVEVATLLRRLLPHEL